MYIHEYAFYSDDIFFLLPFQHYAIVRDCHLIFGYILLYLNLKECACFFESFRCDLIAP